MKYLIYVAFAFTCIHGFTAEAATLTTTPSTDPAVGTIITPPATTGYVVTDTSAPGVLSFTAQSPGESGSGGGIGTISNLAIQVNLSPGESIAGNTLSFSTGSFDDGLRIMVNGVAIVDFNSDDYNSIPAFVAKYDLSGNGTWQPWINEGNPILEIDFQTGTVQLLVDTTTGGREDALNDMGGTPRPNPIPPLDFAAGVTFGSAFNNFVGAGSIGTQNLVFAANIDSRATAVPIGGLAETIMVLLLALAGGSYLVRSRA